MEEANIPIKKSSSSHKKPIEEILWLNILELPYFRGLLRSVEASFYQDLELPSPTLDLGCGDGHFVTAAFDRELEVGLDPSKKPLREAIKRGGYHTFVQGMGNELPFPNDYFGSAMSNSVLEHIPQIEEVIGEISRVLKPGAPFIFCVPNHQFLDSLSIGNFLNRIGLKPIGNIYRSFFNRISRHYHSDAPEVWQERLKRSGFILERWWNYYPPRSLKVTEWGHYFGLPCWIWHTLTGKWILVQARWNLGLTYRLTQKYIDNSECPEGVCAFYLARRNLG